MTGDVTTQGLGPAIVQGVAQALGPSQERTAEAILHLAQSHEASRSAEVEQRATDRVLWGEVRDAQRGVQEEVRRLGDRVVEAVAAVQQQRATAGDVQQAPAAPPDGTVSVPKAWLPWIFAAIFAGQPAGQILSRMIAQPAPVAHTQPAAPGGAP